MLKDDPVYMKWKQKHSDGKELQKEVIIFLVLCFSLFSFWFFHVYWIVRRSCSKGMRQALARRELFESSWKFPGIHSCWRPFSKDDWLLHCTPWMFFMGIQRAPLHKCFRLGHCFWFTQMLARVGKSTFKSNQQYCCNYHPNVQRQL